MTPGEAIESLLKQEVSPAAHLQARLVFHKSGELAVDRAIKAELDVARSAIETIDNQTPAGQVDLAALAFAALEHRLSNVDPSLTLAYLRQRLGNLS